jgi:hypothetical protein
MSTITAIAKITTKHPTYGPIIQGESYVIDAADWGFEVFNQPAAGGDIGIIPSPGRNTQYVQAPSHTYRGMACGDGLYCGGGAVCGAEVCTDESLPIAQPLREVCCGNEVYSGMGVYAGQIL